MALIKQRQRRSEPRVIEPLVNIQEADKEVVLEAELAGLTKEDIKLELKGSDLIIRGKTKEDNDAVPKGYTVVHRERYPREYTRTFVLGDEISKDGIDAQYENGILRVKLTKSEEAQPKKIEIKE